MAHVGQKTQLQAYGVESGFPGFTHFIFGLLPVMNVGACPDPGDDSAAFALLWHRAHQVPTKVASLASLIRHSVSKPSPLCMASGPKPKKLLQVIWLEHGLPAVASALLQTQSGIVAPAFIEVVQGSIGVRPPYHVRNGIGQFTVLLEAFQLKSGERLLALVPLDLAQKLRLASDFEIFQVERGENRDFDFKTFGSYGLKISSTAPAA